MLVVLLKGLLCWLIFGIGMLHAYFPIDDKETSKTHRAVWLLLTFAVLAWVISA